jgi:20S proteasome alpha/beta subunit
MVLEMDGNPEELKKGTTTLGIVVKEGVVMATEHRATAGTLIAHKTTQKLFKIDDHLALCVAGLVGDAQVLARYITAEVQLYRLKHNSEMTVNAASTLMSNILAGRRYFPYWVQLLMGGVDKDGGHVYSLDAAGGSIPDKFVTGRDATHPVLGQHPLNGSQSYDMNAIGFGQGGIAGSGPALLLAGSDGVQRGFDQ